MAENTLMLFTDDQVKNFSQLFDDKYDFTEIIEKQWAGALAELADGPMSKFTFKYINIIASPFIPDEYKVDISAAVDDLFDGDNDYTEAANAVFAILKDLLSNLNASNTVTSLVTAAIELLKTVVNIWLEAKAAE